MVLRVWWFNEFSPGDQIIFDNILTIIERNYKQFGYTHISTPAVERNDVLTAKSWEDASKQIFGLYGLAQWIEDTKDYSLHFDLTVPFARYVLDWQQMLAFPFKRYQIQPVWRGERQQRWRFKEFIQTDIDTIWRWDDSSSYLYYDAETVFALYKTLDEIKKYVWIDDEIQINISNRKILWPFVDYIIWENKEIKHWVFTMIDKFYKISQDDLKKWLSDLWLTQDKVEILFNFVIKDVSYENLLSLVWFIPSEDFDNWIKEFYEVVDNIEKLSKWFWIKVNYKINFLIVRWLDYYTWTVFETFFVNDRSLWSICSGWRYEWLTTHLDKKTNFSGVWWSIWADRFMVKYQEKNNQWKNTIADYLFVNFEETFSKTLELAGKFVNEWKNIEVYPTSAKLKKQFEFADKKWIKFVVILWQWELESWIYKIKNMETGLEEEFKL